MPLTLPTLREIDGVFADWDRTDFPGLAVAVLGGGETIYCRCFGLANVEHSVPITASTLFDLGSLTKQFTAFVTLMLVEEGKIHLDDPLGDHLAELPDHLAQVRLQHCLYHTSGLVDWVEASELAGPSSDYMPKTRAFRSIAAISDRLFPAGQMHSYSNTGYLLLARVIERVSGRTFPEVMQSRIFAPLGMEKAAFRSDPFAFLPGQAQGYFQDEKNQLYAASWPTDVCGDGGLHASLSDVIPWLANLTTRKLGSDVLFKAFFAPGHLDDGRRLRYGAGWLLDCYRGLHSLQHGGQSEGFQSYIYLLPEADLAIVVLGNVRPYLPWRLVTAVADLMITGSEAKQYRTLVSLAPRPSKPDGLVGRYFTATGLPVSVTWLGTRLFVDITLWGRPFDQVSNARDRFAEPHSGDTITFHRSKDGRVTHFTLGTVDGACVPMHSPISHAEKYESWPSDRLDLHAFEGRYVNREIESAYTIAVCQGALVARHIRCFDWHLNPIAQTRSHRFTDEFAQVGPWPGRVAFERNDRGQVVRFRVEAARVALSFHKEPTRRPDSLDERPSSDRS